MGQRGLLAALLLLALVLRGAWLGRPLLWIDEAESAINALTILDHGVPVDHHLGLPLYENTLVRPWPESTEYEFRDLSYSDRGLAVYHSWLPLYAIAGALRLAGVTPEAARRGTPPRDASKEELAWWTAVPRMPSLVFSAFFVFFCFHLGRRVYGPDAGWSMALGAAVSNLLVWFGRQARYYSLTLALSAACGLAVWNACRRGRLLDHGLAGLTLGLLFHTHSLSAVVMGLLYAGGMLLSARQPRLAWKLALASAVSGLIVLPWAWWSGFLGQSTLIPPARQLLDPDAILHSLPSTDPFVLLTAALGVAGLIWTLLRGPRVGERWRRPFAGELPAFAFAIGWLAFAYAGFVLLVPAASYWSTRLQLTVAVPGLLLTTLVLTAAARGLFPNTSRWPASAAMAGLLLTSGQVRLPLSEPPNPTDESDLFRIARSWKLGPGARVLATPNQHLVLTYYTGIPVQSVSALRRDWLEGFQGDLVIVDKIGWYDDLSAEQVRRMARLRGLILTEAEARERGERLRWLLPALDLGPVVEEVSPRPRNLDDFDRELVEAARAGTRRAVNEFARGTPMRSTTFANYYDLWHFFFHWFSNPEARLGPGLNYAGRARRSRAHVLPNGWIVYDCRPQKEPPLLAGSGPSPLPGAAASGSLR